ncbi:MAG TPA: sensor histidine kinase [Rhizomicrobium sp.]
MDAFLTSPRSDLAAEANHRVANTLTLLGGLIRMQAKAIGRADKPFTNAEVRLMLDGIAARVATLGQLHRVLAHAPSDGAVSLNGHLREIGANLIDAFSTKQRPVAIHYAGGDCLVPARHVQSITLILCEILTNAMKYAHPTGIPVKISMLCEASSKDVLEITVSDDGIGLPEDFDTAKDGGLGFQIMRALTTELGATLDIFSDSLGSTFRLSVPNALVANRQTA